VKLLQLGGYSEVRVHASVGAWKLRCPDAGQRIKTVCETASLTIRLLPGIITTRPIARAYLTISEVLKLYQGIVLAANIGEEIRKDSAV
jgi:hypothetical protein